MAGKLSIEAELDIGAAVCVSVFSFSLLFFFFSYFSFVRPPSLPAIGRIFFGTDGNGSDRG